MGSALHIPLSVSPKANSQVKATVYYNTTEGCTALQWLDKEYVYWIPPYRMLD